MTSERKKELLLRKWAACPVRMQVEIAAKFLKKTRNGTMEQSWWSYLDHQLSQPKRPELQVTSPKLS